MVQINTLLDLHPDWIVAGLDIDIKNAFNTGLAPYARRACYADTSTLFYRDDDGYHDFASATGSQQGDPFGGCSSPSPTAPSSSGSKPPSLTSTSDSSASGTAPLSWGPPISSPAPSNG